MRLMLPSLQALLVTAAISTAVLPAQTPASDSLIEAQTRALALELRCPVCQGLSIGDSPSELAREMRGVIRDQLKAGRTPDEVRQYFVQKYGEWILLAPKPAGFNLIVYLVPALFVFVGLFVVWRFIQRSTAASKDALPHSQLADAAAAQSELRSVED